MQWKFIFKVSKLMSRNMWIKYDSIINVSITEKFVFENIGFSFNKLLLDAKANNYDTFVDI